MRVSKIVKGTYGEEIAIRYLQKKGFRIIERNFRIRGGEIDIIALEPATHSGVEVLVFIEVKTRTSFAFGAPLESIGYHKLKSLIKTAQFYKATHKGLPDSMRIDAVSLFLNDQNEITSIELVKNIAEEYT